MLQAILNAKVRGLFDNPQKGKSWRQTYRGCEDFLTAAVVSRLTYLPSDILWKIIIHSSVMKDLPNHVGELEDIQFWPSWIAHEKRKGERVEPDGILSFELADVILEAKIDDEFQQREEQWTNEVFAYCQWRRSEERCQKPIIIWALGGLGTPCKTNTIDDQLKTVKSHLNKYENEQLFIAASPWSNIRDIVLSLHGFYQSKRQDCVLGFSRCAEGHISRILEDIVNALKLHGIRDWHFMSSLAAIWEGEQISPDSISIFSNLTNKTKNTAPTNFDWSYLIHNQYNFEKGLKYFGGIDGSKD